MELNPHADGKTVSVDVVYPSYQRSLPRQKDLSSTFPEVFSKLAVNQEQEVNVEEVCCVIFCVFFWLIVCPNEMRMPKLSVMKTALTLF